MNIIFDLDGTLIDSKQRLYQLFQRLVPVSKLTFDQYWGFKHNRLSNELILSTEFGYSDNDIQRFVQSWMGLIESAEFLSMDSNFDGVKETLVRLSAQARLHVCTARQSRESAVTQLESLGLLNYFERLMVTEQKYSKEFIIGREVSYLTGEDWLIGDTGSDIKVAQSLGINSCAVLSGFMSHDVLVGYEPTRIIDSVVQFAL
ncbi:HAD family hydrolase [Pseudomonas sp. GXZC]|uniref:HAD family hydrolase n=1 Tax=Pseudomonas sp. GXZC TaxID=3003351 RepID=UPI0022AADD83|nr:HAD hydrolase-like protein [Pseudomonas sp. GXZC]WAT30643.1 HAD hydrolase-like protein [Pseudomonas sp. GXZC]